MSLAFGCWHIGDAIHDGHSGGWPGWEIVAGTIGTVVAMTLAARCVLIRLRLRTGSLAAPVLGISDRTRQVSLRKG